MFVKLKEFNERLQMTLESKQHFSEQLQQREQR